MTSERTPSAVTTTLPVMRPATEILKRKLHERLQLADSVKRSRLQQQLPSCSVSTAATGSNSGQQYDSVWHGIALPSTSAVATGFHLNHNSTLPSQHASMSLENTNQPKKKKKKKPPPSAGVGQMSDAADRSLLIPQPTPPPLQQLQQLQRPQQQCLLSEESTKIASKCVISKSGCRATTTPTRPAATTTTTTTVAGRGAVPSNNRIIKFHEYKGPPGAVQRLQHSTTTKATNTTNSSVLAQASVSLTSSSSSSSLSSLVDCTVSNHQPVSDVTMCSGHMFPVMTSLATTTTKTTARWRPEETSGVGESASNGLCTERAQGGWSDPNAGACTTDVHRSFKMNIQSTSAARRHAKTDSNSTGCVVRQQRLSVNQLRAECRRRGLPVSGVKCQLITRLDNAIQPKRTTTSNSQVGNYFHPFVNASSTSSDRSLLRVFVPPHTPSTSPRSSRPLTSSLPSHVSMASYPLPTLDQRLTGAVSAPVEVGNRTEQIANRPSSLSSSSMMRDELQLQKQVSPWSWSADDLLHWQRQQIVHLQQLLQQSRLELFHTQMMQQQRHQQTRHTDVILPATSSSPGCQSLKSPPNYNDVVNQRLSRHDAYGPTWQLNCKTLRNLLHFINNSSETGTSAESAGDEDEGVVCDSTPSCSSTASSLCSQHDDACDDHIASSSSSRIPDSPICRTSTTHAQTEWQQRLANTADDSRVAFASPPNKRCLFAERDGGPHKDAQVAHVPFAAALDSAFGRHDSTDLCDAGLEFADLLDLIQPTASSSSSASSSLAAAAARVAQCTSPASDLHLCLSGASKFPSLRFDDQLFDLDDDPQDIKSVSSDVGYSIQFALETIKSHS